jgi:hypothetical protein
MTNKRWIPHPQRIAAHCGADTTNEILGAEIMPAATSTLKASTKAAYAAAQRWLQESTAG